MTIIDTAFLIAASFFAIYGLMASLECAVAIKIIGHKKPPVQNLFTPMWEITNVFLVFGFTTIAILFSNSLSYISSNLLSVLILALVALLIRGITAISLFYLKPKHYQNLWAGLLCCLNFLVPLCFAAAGVYLMTGDSFLRSDLGLILMLSAFISLVAVGTVLLSVKQNKEKIDSFTSKMYLAWLAMVGSLLPIGLWVVQVENRCPPTLLVSLGLIGLAIYAFCRRQKNYLALSWFTAITAVVAFLGVAWSNHPYLIQGRLRLVSAFSGGAYADFFVIASAIIMPLVILGFWLLYKLLKEPSTDG